MFSSATEVILIISKLEVIRTDRYSDELQTCSITVRCILPAHAATPTQKTYSLFDRSRNPPKYPKLQSAASPEIPPVCAQTLN